MKEEANEQKESEVDALLQERIKAEKLDVSEEATLTPEEIESVRFPFSYFSCVIQLVSENSTC